MAVPPSRWCPLWVLVAALAASAGFCLGRMWAVTPTLQQAVRPPSANMQRALGQRTPATAFTQPIQSDPDIDVSNGPWFAVAAAATLSYPDAAQAIVDPWSVQASDVGPALFSASLLPYLVFLFFLSRPEVKLPRPALVGFAFLLVFVFATIPAGIYAKTQYHAILADVDWLHGGAEALLTVTNLLTVLGLRTAMPKAPEKADGWQPPLANPFKGQYRDAFFFICALGAFFGVGQAVQSGLWLAEPKNALSLPTWMVHVSSMVEYATAMGLVWKLSEVHALPQWRTLTYCMLPLLAGGLTACTFHIFYNSSSLNSLVTLQAFLTLVGNTTCAFGAWQVYQGAKEKAAIESFKATLTRQLAAEEGREESGLAAPRPVPPILRPQTAPLRDTDQQWLAKLALTSLLGALAVKYGALCLGFPFRPEGGLPLALALIFLPTAAAAAYFADKSRRSPILLSER